MGKWSTQNDDKDTVVKVASDGTDRNSGQKVASEFIIQDKNNGDHTHIGFNENGDELFRSDDSRK
jgi:hypothetical protein